LKHNSLAEFVLIDLGSQHEAFGRFTRDWSPIQKLEYLSYFGWIVWFAPPVGEFIHYPTVGSERTAFYFAENDALFAFRIRWMVGNGQHIYENFDRNTRIFDEWFSVSARAKALVEIRTQF
jgi:hypothetical protein